MVLTLHDDHHSHGHGYETDFHKAIEPAGPLSAPAADQMFDLQRWTLREHAETLGRKLDVVDIGCGNLLAGSGRGTGRLFRNLDESARSYVGIEPSWGMIHDVMDGPDPAIRHLRRASLVRGVGERLPFAAGAFDAALVMSTLDHASSADELLGEAHRVLRPGGVVFCSLQNYQSWQRWVARRIAPGYVRARETADHHTPILPGVMRHKLESLGYERIELSGAGYLSALTPRLARVEEWLAWVPLRFVDRRDLGLALNAIDRQLSRVAPERGSVFHVVARTRP